MTVSYTKYGDTTETASETLNGTYIGARLTCEAETYITFTCNTSASAASITNIRCLNCSAGTRGVGEGATYLDTTDSTVSKDINGDGNDENLAYRSDGVLYYALYNTSFDLTIDNAGTSTEGWYYYLKFGNSSETENSVYCYIYSTCSVTISLLNIWNNIENTSATQDDLNYTVNIYRTSSESMESVTLTEKTSNKKTWVTSEITLEAGDYIVVVKTAGGWMNVRLESYTYTIGTDTSGDTFGGCVST